MSAIFYLPLGILIASILACVWMLLEDDSAPIGAMVSLGLGVALFFLVAEVAVHFVVKFW